METKSYDVGFSGNAQEASIIIAAQPDIEIISCSQLTKLPRVQSQRPPDLICDVRVDL